MSNERTNFLAAQITALARDGLSRAEIAAALDLGEDAVAVAMGELSSDDIIREMRDIVATIARADVEVVGGATKLRAAMWTVDELKGRNDARTGVIVNVGDLNIAALNKELRSAREKALEGLLTEAAPVETRAQEFIDATIVNAPVAPVA